MVGTVLGAVFKISRCYVREKPCSAKAAEVEASQRLVPPRTTPAQLGFPFTLRASAERQFILKTAPSLSRLRLLMLPLGVTTHLVVIIQMLRERI